MTKPHEPAGPDAAKGVPDRPAAWDIPALRARLAESSAAGGRTWWRSLEQIADAPEFREMLHREFPERASEWDDGVSRRQFLQVMGASLALAGLTACAKPREGNLVPYVKQPEVLLPGRPLYFATAVTLGGVATGVLVESHMGRPTKIEGNPDHPASLGATDAYTQAAILGLYDPDRARTVTFRGAIRPWSDFVNAMQDERTRLAASGGKGLAFLTGHVTSPTLAAQIDSLLAEMPQARWYQWEPVAQRDNARAGAIAAFGRDVTAIPRFEEMDVVVSLDADFLSEGPGHVSAARHFTRRRKAPRPGSAEADGRGMNRLYVFESCPSPTGAVADHRWRVRASRVSSVARALAAALGVPGFPAVADPASDVPLAAIAAIADDMGAHNGRCLVIAGAHQPAEVHAIAHVINATLGVRHSVKFIEPVEARPEAHLESIRALASAMKAGQVETLVVMGGNPAYDAPADLDFAAAMDALKLRVHFGLQADETSARAHWQVPAAHELESWTDARAFDGTTSLLQPLIEPLYGGRTAHEVLAAFTARPLRTSHDLLRESWESRLAGAPGGFESAWRRALHDGFVGGSASEPVEVSLDPAWTGRLASIDDGGGDAALPQDELELVFRPDPSVYDGRFANNGWLQELPRPMTKITWDNAVLVSPHTAETLGAANGDVVSLTAGGRTIEGPIWVLPGHADGAATLHLGSGRTRAGRVGNGAGFDAGALRTSDAPWIVPRARVSLAGRRYLIAVTQEHGAMEGRELVRSAPLAHFEEHPDFAQHLGEHDPAPDQTMYEPHPYDRYAWGMTIDLGSCIGCNACTIACVAENNIPVVGKDQVSRGREMHWIRVDRYFEGELDDPGIWHQPVPCMQCENAPCEQVCPVAATVHSEEGLNDMVYNRCVGTRYCSNNCPYKVRRFNFLPYADFNEPSLKLLHNPDVTVRSRGVMEKCTYCVQRINHARNDAEAAGRRIGDGDIVTACQQACPASAITFGDINDPASRVSAAKSDPRNYGLLTELNTRPRTTYLAAVRNPNPEIVRESPSTPSTGSGQAGSGQAGSGQAPSSNSGRAPEGPA